MAEGKTTYSIGKDVAKWIEKLFEVEYKPVTIQRRAERMVTNVTNGSTPENQNEIEENQEIKFEHGENAGAT